MTVDAVAAILLAVLTLYAMLAGADFGGGFWASWRAGRSGAGRPGLIHETITPVVGGKPRLADLRPGHLLDRVSDRLRRGDDRVRVPALACRVRDRPARVGFAFRKEVEGLSWQRLIGATFALSRS